MRDTDDSFVRASEGSLHMRDADAHHGDRELSGELCIISPPVLIGRRGGVMSRAQSLIRCWRNQGRHWQSPPNLDRGPSRWYSTENQPPLPRQEEKSRNAAGERTCADRGYPRKCPAGATVTYRPFTSPAHAYRQLPHQGSGSVPSKARNRVLCSYAGSPSLSNLTRGLIWCPGTGIYLAWLIFPQHIGPSYMVLVQGVIGGTACHEPRDHLEPYGRRNPILISGY